MKLYLAGRYSRRAEIAECGDRLVSEGHEIVSRWLLGNHQAENDQLFSGAEAERFAAEDLADLESADVFVAFSEPPRAPSTSRGGRHVEFGFALGRGIPIIVCGPRENVFACLPHVQVVSTIERVAALLAPVEV